MPEFRILPESRVEEIHVASVELLGANGIVVRNREAAELLLENGCSEYEHRITIPEEVTGDCLKSIRASFTLHSLDCNTAFEVGGRKSLFNPGSSAPNMRDQETGLIRKGLRTDLYDIIRVTEGLESLAAQSTALVPSDVPSAIADLYRLYLVLMFSNKPIVTGAFSKAGLIDMFRMLAVFSNGEGTPEEAPNAVFDCCPVSPLTWGDVATQNLMDCARYGLPAAIVPAPLIGATSPVTLQGSLIQSHAEVLSGIVISQLASCGSPLVYGGAPGVLDMRYATPCFSAIESTIVALAGSELGRFIRIPTQAYLGGSDSKTEDTQAGFEAGIALILGALSGIDIISGPGMLAALDCQSLQKLVIDAEICELALSLVEGVPQHPVDEEVAFISNVGPGGDFIGCKHTREHLRSEHIFPSMVVDRIDHNTWSEDGSRTSLDRASQRVDELLSSYQRPAICIEHQEELEEVLEDIFTRNGLSTTEVFFRSE